jgi:hypothetical protein
MRIFLYKNTFSGLDRIKNGSVNANQKKLCS